MITPQDYEKGKAKRRIKLMAIGGTGSGKTTLSASFPKSYFLITEPDGEATILNNKELKSNVVGMDFFIPNSIDDTKRVFEKLEVACLKAREMAKEGKIETLVLDNLTFLVENRWMYINRYEPLYARSGELDIRGLYGQLGRWLYSFVLMKLLACPAHIVVTTHEKLEDEESMLKKPDKSSPICPALLGSFRDTAPGLFSCVFYLTHFKDAQTKKYRYYARTMKGQGKQAKNRYRLQEVIEDVSYKTIMDAIRKGEA